jgi:glycosyltransferase involved in cell wall biosynthesis
MSRGLEPSSRTTTSAGAVPDRAARRVLFVSYPFPPVGGAGVQRTTKFVKYLPCHGWHPSVLTVANPSVPAFDHSLLRDIPAHTLVRRARTWEPSYAVKSAVTVAGGRRPGLLRRLTRTGLRRLSNLLLQPDAQVLWLPGAVREGRRLLAAIPHDAIVATGPPFSSFLIGAALSQQAGLPLVLDYRDEWDLSNAYWENKRPGALARWAQGHMQRRVVRTAKALIATTRCSAAALREMADRAGSRADVGWIYNGFDPQDFAAEPPPAAGGHAPYRLVYTGTLWEMTAVSPLVEAVHRLAAERPGLAANLELVFAGRRTAPQQAALDRLRDLPCRLTEHPYLEHSDALKLLRSAGGLCALLSDLPGVDRVVPAKIFEYMAARRPVLAITPHSECWDILGNYPLVSRFLPGEIEEIAGWLAQQIEANNAGPGPECPAWDSSPYDRRNQTGQLAALLESLR